MIAVAPRSSTTATVSRNRRRLVGTRRPSRPSTPSAKAISVAVGMAQPRRMGVVPGAACAAGPSRCATSQNTSAGPAMPAAAARTGRRRVGAWARSPTSTSRLISSPMAKKNTAISPSLIAARGVRSRGWPLPGSRERSSRACHGWSSGELAMAIAVAATASSTSPANAWPPGGIRRRSRLSRPLTIPPAASATRRATGLSGRGKKLGDGVWALLSNII